MYRMNKLLYQWIRESKNDNSLLSDNIRVLNQLELNEQVPHARKINFTPVVDFENPGTIVVTIPALQPSKDIVCPGHTNKIELHIISARCNTEPVQTRAYLAQSEKKILMDFGSIYKEQTIELPLKTFPKDIVVVAIGVKFVLRDGFSELISFDKSWLPGKIIGAMWKNEM